MKRSLALLCLLIAGCGTPAQRPAPANQATLITPLMLEPPPIYALIGFRERLQLTSQQITALDSVATALNRENSQLVDELREKATPTRNQVGLVVGQTEQPLLQRVRDNNRRAAQSVGELLDPTQEQAACQLFNDEEDTRRSRRADSAQRRRRGPPPRSGGLRPDTTMMTSRGVWPWCGTPAAAAQPRR